jgi:hypothetical protein
MRLQALDKKLRDLAICRLDVGAGRKEQETIHGVALDRRQVVTLGPKQHGEQHRPGHEPADPAQPARLRASQIDDAIREPVPQRMLTEFGG